jgi:Transposase DDE domain
MFLREVKRQNKNGTQVSYLQLVHNEWDPTAQASRTKIVHSFGRTDQVDPATIERLVGSLSRLLGPTAAGARRPGPAGDAELTMRESRPLGGTHVLDGLWRRLGLDTLMAKLLVGSRRDPRVERVLFALVANRALDASSKLAAAGWVCRDVHIDGLAETSDDACYRAMDWLIEIAPELEKQVFWQVATLLDLEVDLLFFDTTSTYFERDTADEPVARDERGRVVPEPDQPSAATPADPAGADPAGADPAGADSPGGADTDSAGSGGAGGGQDRVGFRAYGKSKDHRDDLPQIVIGMAVTRSGIPVRVWCWPGNTTDTALIRQVKDDMRDWTLSRIVWVADRGFSSAENRRYLRRGDHHYIIGEKLRSGSAEATAALSRPGRYAQVAERMRVKEVKISEHERFVICHNPEAADRDAAIRARLLAQLGELIAGSDRLTRDERATLRGIISTKPGLNRFLRVTATGLLRIDKAAIRTETNLDGKYLLRSSDPTLPAVDIALGYKQLLEVERGWRDMKQIIDLRPVYHRLEDRIRAHVLLCWLALVLIRIIETTTQATWNTLAAELRRLHVITYSGPAGTFAQRTELTEAHRAIYTALELAPPKKIIELAAPTG